MTQIENDVTDESDPFDAANKIQMLARWQSLRTGEQYPWHW
jgi:hypothetical protein